MTQVTDITPKKTLTLGGKVPSSTLAGTSADNSNPPAQPAKDVTPVAASVTTQNPSNDFASSSSASALPPRRPRAAAASGVTVEVRGETGRRRRPEGSTSTLTPSSNTAQIAPRGEMASSSRGARADGVANSDNSSPNIRTARRLTDDEREARLRALRTSTTEPAGASSRYRGGLITPQVVDYGIEDKPKETSKAVATPDTQDTDADAVVATNPDVKAVEVAQPVLLDANAPRPSIAPASKTKLYEILHDPSDEEDTGEKRKGAVKAPAKVVVDKRVMEKRRMSRITVVQAINTNSEDPERGRSQAAMRRARQKERMKQSMAGNEPLKVTREVIIPDFITVQELSSRMAERAGNVIKALMSMGMMATVNQSIDADTAELLVSEFGHTPKRVLAGDVEIGMFEDEVLDSTHIYRAPVVTIMGHVDHGKTSLLDAIRSSAVAAGESGGITQHIGAYQINKPEGKKTTFIDTPGHAAFTEMRARGANITDVVVIVVAANDSVMPQTIEAINHAKAANVPMIIAINKCDLPDANPQKVKQDLLNHEVIVEDMNGDVISVEVSAKTGLNLDKLLEMIHLQAEILDLKANPDRKATGRVIESRVDVGRGIVATVLVQNGTLRVGDIFVCGSETGKVRSLTNHKAENMKEAGPSVPVEVTGINGAPMAGDDFAVVADEAKAREITDFRVQKKQQAFASTVTKGSLEQMFAQIKTGASNEIRIILKGDVHGSIEALATAFGKLNAESEEVHLRVLHSGVGPISESDITLAAASKCLVIGFNVRPNASAKLAAQRDKVDIKYYSIIYDALDDMREMLGGMLAPTLKENIIGYAEIRDVFNITKVGKVGGCMVTEGFMRRGARVRLLRDNVVIHEGGLKTLKRFKDEVKEVKEGFECGMAFENYEDIRVSDRIEAFEIESIKRTLGTATTGKFGK